VKAALAWGPGDCVIIPFLFEEEEKNKKFFENPSL
jgi:hypothetical protein